VGAIRTFTLTIMNVTSVTLQVNNINTPPYDFPDAAPMVAAGSSVNIDLGFLPSSISMDGTQTPAPAPPAIPVQTQYTTLSLGVAYQAGASAVTFTLQ